MMPATARPAVSMRLARSLPEASARRSHSADCWGERTGMFMESRGTGTSERGTGAPESRPVPFSVPLSFIAGPDRPPDRDLAVVDPEIEPALGIGADPGLVGDRRSVPPVVGEWNQHPLRALLTRR